MSFYLLFIQEGNRIWRIFKTC